MFDSILGRWSTSLELSEVEAEELAAELNTRYDAYREPGPEVVRCCRRPIPVAVAREWKPAGTIDVWIRDSGEWYARVCDDTGRVRWYPDRDLQPADATTSEVS